MSINELKKRMNLFHLLFLVLKVSYNMLYLDFFKSLLILNHNDLHVSTEITLKINQIC